jgi:hypothetical protein
MELDRWLFDNREFINAKIRRGIEQLDRGEGIPGDIATFRRKIEQLSRFYPMAEATGSCRVAQFSTAKQTVVA